MYKNLRKALLILLSVIFVVCCVAFSACSSCNPESDDRDPDGSQTDNYDGLFAGDSHTYVLTSDYKLTAADVEATTGEDNVTLGYICTFNLGGHTLDLNGYTLNISSSSNEVVKFENGKIKNGALNISVPNGDIEFTATSMDESVTYELEAASETIKFSNSIVSGKCTIKSDTNVNVEYSNVGDLTLAGNGTLTAGNGAELGEITVSENASGATVNISPSATVSNVQLQAAANVSVAGSVSSVTVAESAKNDNASLSITIEETASVDKVELNAAASVSVAGNVSSVKVAESAKNDSADLSIKIEETASVDKVELNAAASVSVAGSVQAVTVGEAAKNDTAELSINVADTADVARVELNAPAAVEVSGGVSNIVVAETAGGSSVTLTETASVTTVAVNANDIKIESDANANVTQVVVSETATNVQSNIEVTTVTKDEMDEYLAHQHVMVVVSRVNATCTQTGTIYYECECGEKIEKSVPALGHSYVYSLIKEPTADEPGIGLYRCIRCGEEYTVEVGYSVSVVIDGLNYLTSYIPDGTYSLTVDKQSPFVIAQENGLTVTVEQVNAVVKAQSGVLNGTFSGSLKMVSSEEDATVSFSAIIEENTVFANYYYDSVRTSSSNYEFEGNVYAMLSGLVKMGLSQFLPFDVEELGSVIPYLSNISGDGDISGLLTLIEDVVDGITTKTTANGNTVYTLDIEKLVASLEALGNTTVAQFIDELLGEGVFDAISDFAENLPDTKIYDVVVTLFDFAKEYGISQETIYTLVQTVLDNFAPGMDMNVEELVKGYYDKTVAETVADIGNITAAQAKEMIANYANLIISTCEDMTISDGITLLLNMSFGGGTEPPKQEVNPGNGNGEDYPNFDVNSYALLSEGEEEGLTYATLLEILGYYGNNVTISFTLSSDNKLVAFEISYLDEQSGIAISIIKTADSAIPEIVVNLMGIEAGMEETDNGAQITVSVMGMLITLEAEETNTGATLSFVMGSGESDLANFELTFTALKDAQNNVYGAEVEVDGEFNAGYEGTFDVSGKFTVENNNDTKLESSVWDSFQGDKSQFYHMDATFSGSSNYVRLQYVSDATGEYYLLTKTVYNSYGSIIETVYTAKLLSIDGLPEVMLLYVDDCTNWIGVELEYFALAEVSETEIAGATLKRDANGIYTAIGGKRGETKTYGTQITNFYGECYYNVKTGECRYESAHELTYTAKLMTGSKQCSDGILVTETCSVCGYTHTYEKHDHFYNEDKTYFTTQCGESSYINKRECIVCDYEDIQVNYSEHYTHNRGYTLTADIAETIKTEYGFDVTGLYYGYVSESHCSVCGLDIYSYSYYTNTAADGCLRHVAYVLKYDGNVDYEAFEYKTEVSSEEHYGSWGSTTEANVNTALAEAEKIIGGSWLFTPDSASYQENRCKGCGKVLQKQIRLSSIQLGGALTLYIDYDNDDEITNWYYSGRLYSLDLAISEAEKYGQSLPEATSGDVYYWASAGESRVEIRLYDKEGNYLYINVNSNKMSVERYIHSECTVIYTDYKLVNGEWNQTSSREREQHDEISEYVYSENCNEDGYYYYYICAVCGHSSEGYDVGYGHSYDYYGVYDSEIYNWAQYITEDYIGNLDATISFVNKCYDCNTLEEVTIVLLNDWILFNDVYIKAEGITLDLNGYSIDLNGYNLVIYSYNGRYLTITDNTFDTSTVPDYDPETFEGYEAGVTNSQDEGILVLFNHCKRYQYREDILIGCISIECDIFGSDTDNRYTIYESLLNDPDYGFLDLPMLKAEKPYWVY